MEIILTKEQETGIAYQANHMGMEVEAYVAFRVQQDADRGNLELKKASISSIQSNLIAEPSIIDEVKIIVDEKVSVIQVAKEEIRLAEEKLEVIEAEVIEK